MVDYMEYVRLRNSQIKYIDKSNFKNFVSKAIDEINFRIKELNLKFKDIDNSTIDLNIDSKTKKFIDSLIEKNISKTNAESIRFLLFLYLLNGKKEVNLDSIRIKLQNIGVL